MVNVNPIRRSLVPVDSGAAQRLCSPNYDEFQSDREIWELLQVQPESVLRVTMRRVRIDSPHAPRERMRDNTTCVRHYYIGLLAWWLL